jgi:hypothetical protein
LIPILLGVVVAGFAIGAILSLIGRNTTAASVANAPASPLAAPASAAPLVAASDAPVTATPKKVGPVRRPAAAPSPTVAPKPTAEPTASAAPSLAPAAQASAEQTPAATPSAVRTPAPAPLATTLRVAATQAPAPVIARSLPASAPRPAVTARPAPLPATGAPGPEIEADSEFSRTAASVVQAYLEALARGDDEAARASLAAPAGSAAAQLSEKAFAGPDMHIAKLEAHGTSDDARVDVDIDTPRGAYFAQFYLKKTGSGAVAIVNHNFIKP